MTEEEVKKAIEDIPIGSRVQLIKKNGDIIEVTLASHSVESVPGKKLRTVEVPELPPALTVTSRTRQGKFRIDVDEISNIAWVER